MRLSNLKSVLTKNKKITKLKRKEKMVIGKKDQHEDWKIKKILT